MYISLIIPMYMAELYIDKCLNSCVKQNLSSKDYEIIVVDDGCTDSSLSIVEKFASTESNILIISQKNKGLSSARNTGLKYAKGDYVWFIDSDDTIRFNCLASIVEQCKNKKLDILAICAANIIENREIRRFSYDKCNDVVTGGYVLEHNYMQHCVPFSIYRRKFLEEHSLKFYHGIFHEDSEFSPRAYFYAKKVWFYNEVCYLVTINPNSITRTFNPKKGIDCLKVAISLDNFFSKEANGKYSSFFHNFISLMINNGMSNFREEPKMSSEQKMYNAFRFEFTNLLVDNKQIISHLKKSSIIKYRIEGLFFTCSPKCSLMIYNFLQMFRISCA